MTKTFKLAGGLLCTYGTTIQGNDASFQVLLPNGRKVEIYSKEGADEFVDTVGTDFISMNLTAADCQELTPVYALILAVAKNASSERQEFLNLRSAPLLNILEIPLIHYLPTATSFVRVQCQCGMSYCCKSSLTSQSILRSSKRLFPMKAWKQLKSSTLLARRMTRPVTR
jgi:hypothetical protein